MALSVRTEKTLELKSNSTQAQITNHKIENGLENKFSLVQKEPKSSNRMLKSYLCRFGFKNKEFRQMSVITQSQYSNEKRMDCAFKITNNRREARLFGDSDLGQTTNPPSNVWLNAER